MRIRTSLPVAFLSIGILASAACSEQGRDITAPEKAALEAPSDASFQRQNVGQATFGNLIAALNNINVQIAALNNIDIQNVDVRVVDIDQLNLNVQQNRILTNFLNNNNVQIDVLRGAIIEVLSNNDITLQDFLNNNDVVITDVIAINVLSGGDIVVFTDVTPTP